MDYLEAFKDYLETLGYGLKTIENHLYNLSLYEKWQAVEKSILSYKNYLENTSSKYGLGLSSSTVYGRLQSLKLYYEYQLEMGLIAKNPLSEIELPKREYQDKYLASEKEIKNLYKACDSYLERSLLSLFYGCGLRRNEGLSLKVSDIHFGESYLIVREGKGLKRRVVPMSKSIKRDFLNYLHYERQIGESDYFLLNTQGTKLQATSANKYLKQIVKRSGQAYLTAHAHLHWLRFLLGCHLLERGMKIEQIQLILGHSTIETTGKYYTRVSENKLSNLLLSA